MLIYSVQIEDGRIVEVPRESLDTTYSSYVFERGETCSISLYINADIDGSGGLTLRKRVGFVRGIIKDIHERQS